MEVALVKAIESVPGLAFAAFVFWLVSQLWGKQLQEQAAERESHRETVDRVVEAFEESIQASVQASDRRMEECSRRCLEAIARAKGVQ